MTDYPLVPPAVAGPGLCLDGDTHLRLSAFNSAAGVTLTVSGLLLQPGGRLQKFTQAHIPATDRTRTTLTIPMGLGYLVSAQIVASAGTPRRGQCFARLELVDATGASFNSLGTILQGYVQDTTALAYPGSPIVPSTDGRGVLRSITGTNPAINTEISETVPTNARWRLRGFRFVFVASGAAANRVPVLTIDDGATILFETASAVVVTAGQTATYVALVGVPFFTLGTRSYQLPLPSELDLPGGSRIRTVTGAIDANDDYAAPQLLVEEWIED